MNRNSRHRFWKVEKLLSEAEEYVSVALKKRAERIEEMKEYWRPKAMLHAIAVAAIAIYGRPRIDEPLVRAWARTLRRHQITSRNEYGRVYEFEPGREHEYGTGFEFEYERELKAAGHELRPIIFKGANETERLTEIFSTAPIWLLEFTWMRSDASILKFDLPEMSDKQVWGERGLADMLRWPLLPLGMMTDGDLLPEVAPESGVSAADEEGSRQRRRISEFIARRRDGSVASQRR